jgi:hypothetical protein
MSLIYMPSLQPVEFPRFRALCNGGLPETFEDWTVAQTLRRRAMVVEGHHVIGVHVGPGDFERHCRSVNCAADAAALEALATRVGTRIYDRTETYYRARAETVVVEDTRSVGAPAPIDDVPVPRRRRWWNWSSWRRPRFGRFFGRRRRLSEYPAE